MDQTKATHSKGNVPFSWENKPGVAKNFQDYNNPKEGHLGMKLPPPPYPTNKVTCKWNPTHHDIQDIPLPPLAFQPPPPASRSSSGKGLKHRDDPFLAAYQECTGSTIQNSNKLSRAGLVRGLRRGLFSLSCKNSYSACDGNLVRVSQLPYESGS